MSNQNKPTMRMPPPNRHGGTPVRMKGEKIDPKVIKRVFGYLSIKHRLMFIGVILCIVVSSLANVASSLFLGSLIDEHIKPMLLSGSTDYSELIKMLVRMAIIFLCGITATFTQNRIMIVIAQGTLKNIRDEMFTHMQSLPIKYFDTNSFGDVMSRYTNDADTLRQMISMSIPQALTSAVTIVSTFTAMVSLSLPLTAVVLVSVGV